MSFKADFVGEPYQVSCYYKITRCLICIYTNQLGVDELIPLFFELDVVIIGLQQRSHRRKDAIAME